MIRFVYPNVDETNNRFVGCGRYLVQPLSDHIAEGYKEAIPFTNNITQIMTVVVQLGLQPSDLTIYEFNDDPSIAYRGDSLDLAYLLAMVNRSRKILLDHTNSHHDIWCTGLIDLLYNERPFLKALLSQYGFDLKLEAFLEDSCTDTLFIVPSPNMTPYCQKLCVDKDVRIIPVEKLKTLENVPHEILRKKTIITVLGREIVDFIQIFFSTPLISPNNSLAASITSSATPDKDVGQKRSIKVSLFPKSFYNVVFAFMSVLILLFPPQVARESEKGLHSVLYHQSVGKQPSDAADNTFYLKQPRNYTYQSSGGTQLGDASLTTPANGATLSSSNVTFTTTIPSGMNIAWLYVDTSVGGKNIYDQSIAGRGKNVTVTVSNIPQDGSTVYVKLWWRDTATSEWESQKYTYQTQNATPHLGDASITSPANNSTLYSTNMTFKLIIPSVLNFAWLYVSTTPGGKNLYDQVITGRGDVVNVSVSNIPQNGSTVYAKLWWRDTATSEWESQKYTYQTQQSSGGD